jgi:hypothetical protein
MPLLAVVSRSRMAAKMDALKILAFFMIFSFIH